MTSRPFTLSIGALCALFFVCLSCKTIPQPVKNSLAYFNTYYNANRLMVETEDEFFYFDEKQRTKPRILILEEATLPDDNPDVYQVPKFAQSMIIPKEKLASVLVRVDSIIIKGSKILSRHAESDFIDGTLFLMAKAFFYKSEWFQAQIKCQELMDNYPYSVLSPDAHLLLAKTLLLQAKFTQADKALLKAIDISWGQHRYDALSEAFRIQAEVALHFGNVDEAVKPYRRAITQADDIMQQSRWQLEIGLLYYRQHRFDAALKELRKVLDFSPDALTRYEAELYTAASLAQMQQFDKAKRFFENLLANRNYAEWRAFSYGELITSMRANNVVQGTDSLYKIADTLGAPEALAAARYQGGLGLMKQREFQGAATFFAKAQVETMPAYFYAAKYLQFLSELQAVAPEALDKLKFFTKVKEDSTTFFHPNQASERKTAAFTMYRTARLYERLGVKDSAMKYYRSAAWLTPAADTNRARYLYSEAALLGMDRRSVKPVRKTSGNNAANNPASSKASAEAPVPIEQIDSLLNSIAYTYPSTEQGIDARARLGLTQEAVRDTASDWMQAGEGFRSLKQYASALQQYKSVAVTYPNSRHASRALYAQGWLYEKDIKNLDSAIRYYSLLVEKYPASPYALEVKPSLDAVLEARRLQDSLRIAKTSTTASISALRSGMVLNTSASAIANTMANAIATSATLTSTNASPQRRRR
jgi:tetratricopeptide (TPR) repeat protein